MTTARRTGGLYHLTTPSDFLAHFDGRHYAPASYASEGFLPLSDRDRCRQQAAEHFQFLPAPLLLLEIDAERVKGAIRRGERTSPPTGLHERGRDCPRLLGRLEVDAIRGAALLRPGDDPDRIPLHPLDEVLASVPADDRREAPIPA